MPSRQLIVVAYDTLMPSRLPAAIVVAHDKPQHFRELIAALQPIPSFVHIDANTPEHVFVEMIQDLPETVTLLPRLHAGWARSEVLEAELAGYRAALRATDAEHFILLTGADYPLASVSAISEYLSHHDGRSFVEIHPIPRPGWGRTGGADRFWFRQWPWRHHRIAIPIPRRSPVDVIRGAGSQSKILCRSDAEYIDRILEERPDLWGYFRRCWTPDEVTIQSLLSSTKLGSGWDGVTSHKPPPWYIDWGTTPARNPRWLTKEDFPLLQAARFRKHQPVLFARKLSDTSTELLSLIDSELRTAPAPPPE